MDTNLMHVLYQRLLENEHSTEADKGLEEYQYNHFLYCIYFTRNTTTEHVVALILCINNYSTFHGCAGKVVQAVNLREITLYFNFKLKTCCCCRVEVSS